MSYWKDNDKHELAHENRRMGEDYASKYIRFGSFLSWLLIALSALLADAATPTEFNIYVLDDKWGKNSNVFFRESYVYAGMFILGLAFLIILISLFIDTQHQKRKTDHISYSLLLGLFVSFAGLMAYLIYFIA